MKKYTEKIIYIVVILILFSATIGCSLNSEQRADEYVIAVDDYSIIKEKGDCYIAFDNISLYENNNQSVPATIRFDSVKEFKTSIIQGKLSDSQKKIMSQFAKDEKGRIKTCDFNNLYVPTFPIGSLLGSLYWEGEGYSYEVYSDSDMFAFFSFITQESFEKIYQTEYIDIITNNDLCTITNQYIDNEQREVTYYYTSSAELKQVRYSLSDGKKHIIIDKMFQLTTSYPDLIDVSSSVPSRITMYCTEGSNHYIVMLYALNEDPSDSYLMSFGSEKYVDNVSIEK